MATLYYRVIANPAPVEWDFMSNFAKGKPPRRSEISNPAEHRAISAFADLEGARYVQDRYPRMGRYVAVVDVELADSPIEAWKADADPASTHYNLLGEPATSFRCVREVLGPF